MADAVRGGVHDGAGDRAASHMLASTSGQPGQRGGSAAARKAREEEATKLWREWATERLGPMSATPTAEELRNKSQSVKRLERKCAELASMAQRRVQMSASLRTFGGNGVSSSLLVGPSSSREVAYAAREKRQQLAYQAAVNEGRKASGAPQIPASPGAGAGGHGPAPTSLQSRGMLQQLISTGSVTPLGRAARPQSAVPSALATAGSGEGRAVGAEGSGVKARMRPQSAAASLQRSGSFASNGRPSASGRPASGVAASRAGGAGAAAGMGMSEAELAGLLSEAEAMRAQLDDTKLAMEGQSELEQQLRDTIDMLRARLHAQSQREVESQRRLQHAQHVQPLFEKLAETFTFKTPEEVIARLEFLEDDKMGTFDQLIRAQEEVAALQHQVQEAVKRTDIVRTQMGTEHIQSTARLQQQNEELMAEIEAMETLNSKLEARQNQLVGLQTAVLELWGRCQADPAFVRANTVGEISQEQALKDMDPLSILSMVQEYLIARSSQLSSRHYLDVQKVANRVWLHHFKHKKDIRGKVVATFEQLSTLSDMMAAKLKLVSEQLNNSKSSEKSMADALKRMEIQKRQLEAELQRRDDIARKEAGLPRRERTQHSSPAGLGFDTASMYSRATSRNGSPERAGAHSASTGGPAGLSRSPSMMSRSLNLPPRPGSAKPELLRASGNSFAARLAASQSAGAAAVAAASAAQGQAQAGVGRASTGTYAGSRPSSAPAKRRPVSGSSRASSVRYPAHSRMVSEAGGEEDEVVYAGEDQRQQQQQVGAWGQVRPHSARPAPGNPGAGSSAAAAAAATAQNITTRPFGDHWQAYGATTQRPASATSGALFGAAKQSQQQPQQQGQTAGPQAQARWVPPARAQIESSFLSRLERASQY